MTDGITTFEDGCGDRAPAQVADRHRLGDRGASEA